MKANNNGLRAKDQFTVDKVSRFEVSRDHTGLRQVSQVLVQGLIQGIFTEGANKSFHRLLSHISSSHMHASQSSVWVLFDIPEYGTRIPYRVS